MLKSDVDDKYKNNWELIYTFLSAVTKDWMRKSYSKEKKVETLRFLRILLFSLV